MILITGATGHFGKAVIDHLLKSVQASKIAALARTKEKAEALKQKGVDVRIGSFDDASSLPAILQGIEKVLLVSTGDLGRFQQHKNLIDAARAANVKHIVYTSVSLRNLETSAIKSLMESHYQTEDHIKQSGMAYTFLRNTLYAETIPGDLGDDILTSGTITYPAGDGKVPFALRAEMAEAAAKVLSSEAHEHKVYTITGSELYSFTDIANLLSELSGRTITYSPSDSTSYKQALLDNGLPEIAADIITGFASDIKNKNFEMVSDDLATLIGRSPASLKDALKQIYKLL